MMQALDKFVKRVEQSTKARSKEIRITLNEAQEMVFEITKILMIENDLLEKINNLHEGKTIEGKDPYKDLVVQASVDGGKFNP